MQKLSDYQYACAPMDGVTDYVFRRVQARIFSPADEYYTPFLSLTRGHGFQKKESGEIMPEHNAGLHVIPQLIGNDIDDFLWGIDEITDLGYDEINLNAGCPSKVVVKKQKGAGMLKDPDSLERMLDRIFSERDVKLSVKTRIGLHSREEFPDILKVFNRFPLTRLIVHARFSDQNYTGSVDRDAWEYAVAYSTNPLCYNGDLFDETCVRNWAEVNSAVSQLMIGRGLVANPALIGSLRGEAGLTAESFVVFHDALCEEELEKIGSEAYLLECMKEFWNYFGCLFEEGEASLKAIRQSRELSEYREAVCRMTQECRMRKNPGYIPIG